MAHVIEPRPLTRDDFAPFGEVIETEGARHYPINEGTTTRFHDLASIDVASEGGTPLVSIFRATARPKPIRLWLMERHPLGSQAFFPLADHGWLVVVAQGDDPLDPGSLRCFAAHGRQGVNYRAGVWHHPLLVLEPAQDFLVIDRGGPGDNLEERRFPAGDPVIVSD
jgi:ureidoglycolate lyase